MELGTLLRSFVTKVCRKVAIPYRAGKGEVAFVISLSHLGCRQPFAGGALELQAVAMHRRQGIPAYPCFLPFRGPWKGLLCCISWTLWGGDFLRSSCSRTAACDNHVYTMSSGIFVETASDRTWYHSTKASPVFLSKTEWS